MKQMTSLLLLSSLFLSGCNGSEATTNTSAPVDKPAVEAPASSGSSTTSTSGGETSTSTDPAKDPETASGSTSAGPPQIKGKVEEGLKFRDKRTIQARFNQLNELDVVKLTLAGKQFYCYVADTNAKRMEGLMHVEEEDLAKDEAMLFLFPTPTELAFWMRNTRIDLDIAYLDKNRKVVSMHTMKAYDETPVPAAGLSQYAIEFRKGVLKEIKAKKGEKALWNPDLESSDSERG